MKRAVSGMWRRTVAPITLVAVAGLVAGLAGCFLFNVSPEAGFTIGPSTAGTAPFTVSLSAAPSSDPDGEIEKYSWDFGDGSQGTGRNVAHTYTTPGTFTIVLTVEDNYGATDQALKNVYVTAPEPAGPTARFTASPSSGTSPLTVSFNAAASTYEAGTIVAYDWSFGDGATGFGLNATHTYFSATTQTFTVTLTVRASDGKLGSTTSTVRVSPAGGGGTTPSPGAPSARFDILFEDPAVADDAYTNKAVAPVRVWLDPGDSAAGTGRTLLTYAWSFGDGASASSVGADVQEHVYTTSSPSKVFSVTLVVIDNVGSSGSITKTVKVENYQPIAGFEFARNLDLGAAPGPANENWGTDLQDGADDGRWTYSNVTTGLNKVWIRSRQIQDTGTLVWIGKAADDPVPTTKTGTPLDYSKTDGSNMCYDPEGQTWAAGTPPIWFTNRSWGIQTLKIQWGDGTTDFVPFVDNADTVASHEYTFDGGVRQWTITVTAIDFLGAETSHARTMQMQTAAP